ncbi:ROK family protein [Oceanobacillus manasiensis]|uniref:ROK family protein n=1 Tax=Oceanobacillus manasiensis TaxID=586413 RepID=UPI0005A5FAB9|nr:ROK family protein [Oceanobacillus manasiensis]
MSLAVGVDIGGTKTAIGIIDHAGKILSHTKIPTDQGIVPAEMIDRIIASIKVLLTDNGLQESDITGIGVGAPGPLDVKNGLISCPPNLPQWVDIPVVHQFNQQFSVPVWLANDASAAAVAEKWIGAGTSANDFAYMTISTGIGAGFILNGELYTGARGNAGDIGHMAVDTRVEGTCDCGQKGCFEYVASGTAIARLGTELMGKPLSSIDVFALYNEGDPDITSMVQEVFERIGMGCVTLINTLEPEFIVIGGGVSNVGEALFEAVNDYVSKYALSPLGRETRVVPSKLENNTGLIGAAALVWQNTGKL